MLKVAFRRSSRIAEAQLYQYNCAFFCSLQNTKTHSSLTIQTSLRHTKVPENTFQTLVGYSIFTYLLKLELFTIQGGFRMTKKFQLFIACLLVALLALSACGKEDEPKKEIKKEDFSTEKKPVETDEKEDSPDEAENEKKDEGEQDKETVQSSTDFSELISFMAEETEGTTKVLYENNEQQIHKTEDFSVSLDGYTFVALDDFHTNYAIPFRDQTDGFVILTQFTVTNDTDADAYFTPSLSMTVSHEGRERAHSNNNALTPRDGQLATKIGPSNDNLIKAGESISGYAAYSFGETEYDTLMDLGILNMSVPKPRTDKDDFGSTFGEEGRFKLPLNEENAKKDAQNKSFYEDKVTFDNMGEKVMIKEKSAIGDQQELGDAQVTLEGYQFTEFTPSADEAPRFESFTNGIVLLTTKFDVKNNGEETLDLSMLNSKLLVNDGAQYQFNEGMLLKLGQKIIIKTDQEDEFLQIFILDKEQYDKIWKEKSFQIEVGPFKNEESKDVSKGKTVTFTLPN